MRNLSGKIVDYLSTRHSKTHEYSSTDICNSSNYVVRTSEKLAHIPVSMNTLLPTLSTLLIQQSPLMNTFFTLFPQPLLLERQKKI